MNQMAHWIIVQVIHEFYWQSPINDICNIMYDDYSNTKYFNNYYNCKENGANKTVEYDGIIRHLSVVFYKRCILYIFFVSILGFFLKIY